MQISWNRSGIRNINILYPSRDPSRHLYIFGIRRVLVYVTGIGKENGARRLFLVLFSHEVTDFLCPAGEDALELEVVGSSIPPVPLLIQMEY